MIQTPPGWDRNAYLVSPEFRDDLLATAARYRALHMPLAAERFDEAAEAVDRLLEPQPDLLGGVA